MVAYFFHALSADYYQLRNVKDALTYYFRAMLLLIKHYKKYGKLPEKIEESSSTVLCSDINHSDYILSLIEIMGKEGQELNIPDLNPVGVMRIFIEKKGDFAETASYFLKMFEDYLGIADPKKSDHRDIAFFYESIGFALYTINNYSESIKYHKKAHDIRRRCYKRIGIHPEIARSLIWIGNCNHEQKNYAEALNHLHEAIAILKKIQESYPQHELMLEAYSILLSCYLDSENFREARESLTDYIGICSKTRKKDFHLAWAHRERARILEIEGDYDKALIDYFAAVEILQKNDIFFNESMLDCYMQIGTLYLQKQEYQKASDYFSIARDISPMISLDKHQEIDNYIILCSKRDMAQG